MKAKGLFLWAILMVLGSGAALAQMGLSVSPPRVYYTVDNGQTDVQEVLVTNVSETHTMELAFSLGDWEYDRYGENKMFPADTLKNSCAAWVTIEGDQYLSLKPKESKVVHVSITVPFDLEHDEPARTAMLYVTQMNPVDDVNTQGANIKVSVQSGIKLFVRGSEPRLPQIDITNMKFEKESQILILEFNNEGNVWINGEVSTYLLNQSTGEELTVTGNYFYTMPGDERVMRIALPEEMTKAKYTATVMLDYGDSEHMEAAELEFNYE